MSATAAIPFGDTWIDVRLPEGTRTIQAPPPLPALADPVSAVREALRHPLGHEPLGKLAGPGARVTIAFDDPTLPVTPMATFTRRPRMFAMGGSRTGLAVPATLPMAARHPARQSWAKSGSVR